MWLLKNRKFLGFAAAFGILGLFTIAFGILHDFAFNAKWKNDELAKYGEFGKGVWLVEARTKATHDILFAIRGSKNRNIVAYYKDFELLPSLIKYDKGAEWAIPHELGHHYYYARMNESEREKWCSTFDWTNWSYDFSCNEGFAEWFGQNVIKYFPLVEIEKYNLAEGITKWKGKE